MLLFVALVVPGFTGDTLKQEGELCKALRNAKV